MAARGGGEQGRLRVVTVEDVLVAGGYVAAAGAVVVWVGVIVGAWREVTGRLGLGGCGDASADEQGAEVA
ncbi:MAG: hypothetical protein Q8L55_14120 [Phycisphaerales bacterium]|nr:hypothetical protein [Phycisphaerales bacterium]